MNGNEASGSINDGKFIYKWSDLCSMNLVRFQ